MEAGGTTWVVAVANEKEEILDRIEIPTTKPDETIQKAIDWLCTKDIQAIGIASFGPVDLDPNSPTYGYITSTPKPFWKDTDVVGPFRAAFDVPIAFDTDVNAPAVYEQQHGQPGETTICYITIGTGVGVGICMDGRPVHGAMHPEAGHVFVPIAQTDLDAGFKGVCPYHSYCVEGMAASGSVAARTGVERTALQTLADDDPVWDCVAHYIGMLCINLTLTVSPHAIVIGGGLAKRVCIFEKIRSHFVSGLNAYVSIKAPLEQYIRSSRNSEGGITSCITLALSICGIDDFKAIL